MIEQAPLRNHFCCYSIESGTVAVMTVKLLQNLSKNCEMISTPSSKP